MYPVLHVHPVCNAFMVEFAGATEHALALIVLDHVFKLHGAHEYCVTLDVAV